MDSRWFAVLITHAALDSIAPAAVGVGGHLACFNEHRDAIELIASTKHQRRQIEDSAVVLVDESDLKISGF